MSSPNPDDPLDESIAEHWKNDEDDALRVGASRFSHSSNCTRGKLRGPEVLSVGIGAAREWTRAYANSTDS
jgi:hypothetical protein